MDKLYVEISCDQEDWLLCCNRAAIIVAVKLRNIQKDGGLGFDGANFLDLHWKAMTVAVKSFMGDEESLDTVTMAQEIYTQQNKEQQKYVH